MKCICYILELASIYVLQKLIFKTSKSYISQEMVGILQQQLNNLSKNIPVEFKRKSFDLMDLGNWKATQFRFFLLYGIVLREILESNQYRHFMILYAACRIFVYSSKLATLKAQYAKSILKTFIKLMPQYYGPKSHIMNIHNLIHISDDVVNIGAPISAFSAFDFENSLGYIKSLIKSFNIPLLKFRENYTFFIRSIQRIKFHCCIRSI